MNRTTQLSPLIALTALLLVSVLPSVAATSSTSYSLTVQVQMTTPGTPPNWLNFTLTNSATGQSCQAPTNGGSVVFDTANCPVLGAGWWQVYMPPQQLTITPSSIWYATPSNSTGISVSLGQPSGATVYASYPGISVVQSTSTLTGTLNGVVPGASYRVSLINPAFPNNPIATTAVTAPGLFVNPISQVPVSSPSGANPLGTTYNITVNTSPTSCSITFNGAQYLNGQTIKNVTAGTYPIVANACTGATFSTWSSTAGPVSTPTLANTTISVSSSGALTATYTTTTATYTLKNVPMGTWTLFTTGLGSNSFNLPRYNYTSVDINSASVTRNITISDYLLWGNFMTPTGVLNGTGSNITIWDATTHHVYSSFWPSTGSTYYQSGLYSAGLGTKGGNQTFVAFLSPRGYNSSFHSLTVSPTKPTVEFNPSSVPGPSEKYSTTLDFGSNFSKVTVSSSAILNSSGVFSQLPNASIGNLWAQLGLDFNNSELSFSTTNYAAFSQWLTNNGPIFPAESYGLSVNGTPFLDNKAYTSTHSNPAASGPLSYASSNGYSYSTAATYNLSKALKANYSSYTLSMGFSYPSDSQSMNYTVNLPQGYVLKNNTAAPPNSNLTAAGPMGTLGRLWTSFSLTTHPYAHSIGYANFTIYKIENVSAIVNVSSTNFAFSEKNILNKTLNNYTVVVGSAKSITLTASHSRVPPTMNITAYLWNLTGPSGSFNINTRNATTNYTFATGGEYHGRLTIVASGGNKNTTNFTIYVSSENPTAKISLNDTHVQSANGIPYVYVNWSRVLQFNATGSNDTIAPTVPPSQLPGNISVASWNISSYKAYKVVNYTVGQNANVFSNFSFQFNGAGHYYSNNVTIGGVALHLVGWVYTISLVVWDAGGNRANTTLYVLVNDTEKPVAFGSVQNSAGKNITGGLVENKNGTVMVKLLDKYSYDPHNGSLSFYSWRVVNSAGANVSSCHMNATKACYWNATSAQVVGLYLPSSTATYNFTLNVTDLAGNKANSTYPVTVAQNLTVRPILTVGNLTAPSTMTEGTSYTIWVNVNNTGYKTSTANNVTVAFYLTNPEGTNRVNIGGSPASVKWFGYTKGVVNSSATYTGTEPSIKANQTWRAEITYTPSGPTGSLELWANASASNEFSGQYSNKANVAHTLITINQNPLTFYLEVAAIVVAVVVILAIVILVYRRRKMGGTSPKKESKGKATKEDSGKEKSKPAEEKDDDEE